MLTGFTGRGNFELKVTIPAGSSRDEPRTATRRGVAAKPITLSWTNFRSAAEQAGLSRQYGGVHFEHASRSGRHSGRQGRPPAGSRGLGDQHPRRRSRRAIGLQRPAQVRHVGLQRGGRLGRWLLAPQPHSSSISWSSATTWLACTSNTASRTRCFGRPSSTRRWPSRTSTGPRIRNCTAPPPPGALRPAAPTRDARRGPARAHHPFRSIDVPLRHHRQAGERRRQLRRLLDGEHIPCRESVYRSNSERSRVRCGGRVGSKVGWPGWPPHLGAGCLRGDTMPRGRSHRGRDRQGGLARPPPTFVVGDVTVFARRSGCRE